jgi:hypothetical protein
MPRVLVLLVVLPGYLLGSTPAAAEAPVVSVETLCVSVEDGRAAGLTARAWDDLSPSYNDILRNDMVLVLAPSEPPGEFHRRVCAKFTEVDGTSTRPYVPSAVPVTVKYGGMSKFTPESTYQIAVRGLIVQ